MRHERDTETTPSRTSVGPHRSVTEETRADGHNDSVLPENTDTPRRGAHARSAAPDPPSGRGAPAPRAFQRPRWAPSVSSEGVTTSPSVQ